MKKISRNLIVFALTLSHIMCIAVAYNYSQMLCGIEHQGFSAPAEIAFLFAVPFLLVIGGCFTLAYILNKRK